MLFDNRRLFGKLSAAFIPQILDKLNYPTRLVNGDLCPTEVVSDPTVVNRHRHEVNLTVVS